MQGHDHSIFENLTVELRKEDNINMDLRKMPYED